MGYHVTHYRTLNRTRISFFLLTFHIISLSNCQFHGLLSDPQSDDVLLSWKEADFKKTLHIFLFLRVLQFLQHPYCAIDPIPPSIWRGINGSSGRCSSRIASSSPAIVGTLPRSSLLLFWRHFTHTLMSRGFSPCLRCSEGSLQRGYFTKEKLLSFNLRMILSHSIDENDCSIRLRRTRLPHTSREKVTAFKSLHRDIRV